MISGNLYHIYNRGNNSQKIFFEEENYRFFIDKIRKHLLPFSDILAYCLMPNHFHLLIVVKSSNLSDGSKPSDRLSSEPSDRLNSSDGMEANKAMGVILRSYAQAINKRFNRTGSLFQQKTSFKPIDSNEYARTVFHYIHQNPLKAGLVEKMENWPYSSFKDYLSNTSVGLCNKNIATELIDFPLEVDNFYRESYEVIKSVELKSVELIDLENCVTTFKKQSKTIGLALSGGGARGIAHLGVIKALEQNGVKIDFLSGTSAGAIIAGLYAYGHGIEDILKILLELKTFKFLQPAMSTKGLLKTKVMYDLLKRHLPEATFDSLKIPTYIAATNLRLGETKYFNDGDLISAICASSCIPVLFKPVEIDNELFIDGGILNNLPIEPIRDKVEVLIASHSNPIDTDFKPKNFRFVMERALMLAITRNVYERRPECDLFIEPKGLESFKVMDINKAQEIFEIGYTEALKQFEEQKLLERI